MISSALQGRGASHCHNHGPFLSLLGADNRTRAFWELPKVLAHKPLYCWSPLEKKGNSFPLFSFLGIGYPPKEHICDACLNSPKPTIPQSFLKANSTYWFIQASAELTPQLPLPAPGSATRNALDPHPTLHMVHLPHLDYFHSASYQPPPQLSSSTLQGEVLPPFQQVQSPMGVHLIILKDLAHLL